MTPRVTDEVRLSAIRMKLMEAERLLYETNKILIYMLEERHDDSQAPPLVEPECQE